MKLDLAMLSAQHPLRTMWMLPRTTIRQIVDNDPEYGVFALAALAGAAQASIEVAGRWGAAEIPLVIVVTLVFVAGTVRGFVSLYLEGWLLLIIGRWLGGSASGAEVRAAIAWSNLPLLAGVASWWILFMLQPVLGFTEIYADVIIVTLFLWSFLMLALCLGVVQRFSLWRSVINMVGAWLLMLAGIAVLMLIAGAPLYMLMNGGLLTMTGGAS